MVYLRKERKRERYPKLQMRRFGNNAYEVDLPLEWRISRSFNVADLTHFVGDIILPIPLPSDFTRVSATASDQVEGVVNVASTSTRQGTYDRFLVKWRNRPFSENTWLSDATFQQLDPDFYRMTCFLFQATGVHSMTFHPDGKTLFCGLEDSLKVFAWEPIICHDSVDMGWSTLGDLNISEGKLLGCSYYHNCVGVWAADVSLFGPYAAGVPPRSNGHRQHKFGIQESQSLQEVGNTIKSNAGLLKTPPDDETPEIRNIYVDTSGSNKIFQKRMGTIISSKVVLPLDSSKNSSPSMVEEISVMEVSMRNSQVTDKQFTVPSPRNDSSAATAVSSRREGTLTETTNPGIELKPSHMRRSSNTLFETEKLSLPTESESSSPSTLKNISELEVPIRSNSQVNYVQFTVPLIVPRNDSTAANAVSSRREVTLTETTIPGTRLKPSHMRRSSNTKYEAEKLSLPSESETSKPASLKNISEMEVPMRSNSQVNNRQFTVPLSVPRSDSNAVDTRREVTLTEATTLGTGLKPSHMRRSSNTKYETEKLLLHTESGRFSTQVGGPIISPDQKAHSRLLSKVESTQSVEDSHKELRSVAKKFERILPLETPIRTSGDSGVDSQCDSKVITSSNKVNQVKFGRTRSLVERWEKREICSTDEPLTSTTSTNVMPECHTHAHILNEKKEQPQTTGRESASINDENVLEDLMQNHDSFMGCFNSRLAKLQVVRYFWQRNDVKGGLNAVGKLPDHSVQADVVSVLVEKMDIVSLELFSCLLPILLSLLNSQIDRHTNVSLEMLLKLVAIFGSVIRLTIYASPSVGVDLQAERRLECCRQCSIQLQKIKQIIPSVIRRGGLLTKYAQELHLLLQES
ncbi:Katanin p80 wd40 repeat-containing subunit b1-like protein [Thalictrum thalictroides]|uniref:Katanin p80 wd40 repeat-containing subunit b1-like protein n=1 Tax=Thalictrum thalictroides TaxID=46969 RepID=A0A7J6UV87_THATH|nr:Katanin p80 wd40 repeat-containing subunit b1-like protein [Thalictrum thalictroides]